MDDYYELLGVETNAPVDDIRAAYRDKKAAIDTSANDSARTQAPSRPSARPLSMSRSGAGTHR